VVDTVALGQVFSEYFGFPCQLSFHTLLHNHHLSSGAGTIGQLEAEVPSELSLTPLRKLKKNKTWSLTVGSPNFSEECAEGNIWIHKVTQQLAIASARISFLRGEARKFPEKLALEQLRIYFAHHHAVYVSPQDLFKILQLQFFVYLLLALNLILFYKSAEGRLVHDLFPPPCANMGSYDITVIQFVGAYIM
jgi:hypothetical protein